MRITAFSGRMALITIMLLVGSTTETVPGMASEEPTTLKLEARVVELSLLEEDKNAIRFAIKLRLTFINDGNEPLILLKQEFGVGAEMLARNCEEARQDQYVYTKRQWPSRSGDPAWANWRRKLHTKQPSASLIYLLGRGHSVLVDAQTAIHIDKPGNWDKTNKPWDEIKQSSNLCLQVELETWPVNIEPKGRPENLEFGRSLQQRWKSYGTLQLGHIRSEPLEIKLPSQ